MYRLTCCSRRPNHMPEAENLHPTPTLAPTPTHAIDTHTYTCSYTCTYTYACNRKAFRERSGSPQNGQKDPKTPAPGPPKNPNQAEEGLSGPQRFPHLPSGSQRFGSAERPAKPTASEAPDASGGAEKKLLPPGWGSFFSCNSRAPVGTSGGTDKLYFFSTTARIGSFTGCRLRRPFSTTARAKWWC